MIKVNSGADDGTYRLIRDYLGSVRSVVNVGTGEIKQRLDYDSYGNVTLDTNPGFQPLGFAGGLYDSHTKLVKFGFRDYDPTTGRFTTKDPIGLNGGANVYLYAMGNPVVFVDRVGLGPTPLPNAFIHRSYLLGVRFHDGIIFQHHNSNSWITADFDNGVRSDIPVVGLFIQGFGHLHSAILVNRGDFDVRPHQDFASAKFHVDPKSNHDYIPLGYVDAYQSQNMYDNVSSLDYNRTTPYSLNPLVWSNCQTVTQDIWNSRNNEMTSIDNFVDDFLGETFAKLLPDFAGY
jgi:RHS repeat-associated protein